MDKKYQVFVSSTYVDLVDERREVLQALLELDCIPVGMEMFPAADDDQWTLIKRLIEDCDYYILVVGGRYGSLNSDGIGYTQMEYQYALDQEIPIISFLHKKPSDIAIGKSETDTNQIERLRNFKELVERKMCRYWETPSELGSQVSRSLIKLIKDKPRAGWVKATNLPTEDSTKEILELRKHVEQLQLELKGSKTSIPEGTESLSQGDDKINIIFSFTAAGEDWRTQSQKMQDEVSLSWNLIFSHISPILLDEVSEVTLRQSINGLIRQSTYKHLKEQLEEEQRYPTEYQINDSDFQTIKIQLRALSLITESIRKRSIHDKGKYWTLTPYGDTIMTRLRAIRK